MNDFRMAPGSSAPADLCPVHAAEWEKWRAYALSYDPTHPKEFGHLGGIMDSRTSHEERRRTWIFKGREQLDQVEGICRSGSSPQCNRLSKSWRVG